MNRRQRLYLGLAMCIWGVVASFAEPYITSLLLFIGQFSGLPGALMVASALDRRGE